MKRRRIKMGKRRPLYGFSYVVGENRWIPRVPRGGSPIQRLADRRRRLQPTAAERRLEQILNELNGGVLRGSFHREWGFARKHILDFFFWEVRLGIEVDGPYHLDPDQQVRDRLKEQALKNLDVTLIRIQNEEVFGDRELLIQRLRQGWAAATRKQRGLVLATSESPGGLLKHDQSRA